MGLFVCKKIPTAFERPRGDARKTARNSSSISSLRRCRSTMVSVFYFRSRKAFFPAVPRSPFTGQWPKGRAGCCNYSTVLPSLGHTLRYIFYSACLRGPRFFFFFFGRRVAGHFWVKSLRGIRGHGLECQGGRSFHMPIAQGG